MTLIDPENPVVQLCVEGMRAESRGRHDAARALYQQAWEKAETPMDACVAAHYRARQGVDAQDVLHWNRVAVEQADAVDGDGARHFYPSLYLNLGHSYETLGQLDDAKRCYARAESHLSALPAELYDGNAAQGLLAARQRIAAAAP